MFIHDKIQGDILSIVNDDLAIARPLQLATDWCRLVGS